MSRKRALVMIAFSSVGLSCLIVGQWSDAEMVGILIALFLSVVVKE